MKKKKKHHHKKISKKKKISKDRIKLVIAIIAILVIAILITNIGKLVPKPKEVPDNVVVSVDGKHITEEDVEDEIAKLHPQLLLMYSEEDLRKTVIEQLVAKELLLQKAEKENIVVTGAEVNESFNSAIAQLGKTIEEFEEMIAQDNMSIEELKADHKIQLIIAKLLNKSLETPEISDSEIKEYFDANKDTLVKVKASHILICYEGTTRCTNNRTEEEALSLINEIKQKIIAGESFASLAQEYSTDPTAEFNNGSLGWFNKGMMVKEFEDAAFSLNINQISDPVKTDFGYHILKTEDKIDTSGHFKDIIKETLLEEKRGASFTLYLNELKTKANIIYYEQESPAITGAAVVEGITTFQMKDNEVCKENTLPVVRLYTTTNCPHCTWIAETFDSVMEEYMTQGKIIAHHWQLDTGDDTLTSIKETEVPATEKLVFQQFGGQGVPTFVFGCKYFRIGNGFESQNNLAAEEAEFRAVIEELLKEK